MNRFRVINLGLWMLLGLLLSWADINLIDQPLKFVSICVTVLLIELSFLEC